MTLTNDSSTQTNSTRTASFEFHEIEPLLPFGPAWILIDRVASLAPHASIVCEKAVSASDPLIFAHFRSGPRIVPGVLLIEMVGQAAYLLNRLSAGPSHTHAAEASPSVPEIRLLGRCSATFHATARAGSVLEIRVARQDVVNGVVVCRGEVFAAGTRLCTVQIFGAPALNAGGK